MLVRSLRSHHVSERTTGHVLDRHAGLVVALAHGAGPGRGGT